MMADPAELLPEFLADMARSPHVWGERDCAMSIANWWRMRFGVDPAADLRGTYDSAAECVALIEARGGMVMLIGAIADRAGARVTLQPEPGDFGVISAYGFEFGAVLGPSGRWMVKAATGVAGYRCAALKAWTA